MKISHEIYVYFLVFWTGCYPLNCLCRWCFFFFGWGAVVRIIPPEIKFFWLFHLWPRGKIYINLRVILSGEERVPFRLVHKSRQKNHEKSWGWYQFSVIKLIPKHSMCGIFTSIYRKNEANVGRYTAYNECLGSHLRYQSATEFFKVVAPHVVPPLAGQTAHQLGVFNKAISIRCTSWILSTSYVNDSISTQLHHAFSMCMAKNESPFS